MIRCMLAIDAQQVDYEKKRCTLAQLESGVVTLCRIHPVRTTRTLRLVSTYYTSL